VGPNGSAAHINGQLTADDALTSTNEYYVMSAYTDAAGNGGACAGSGSPPNGVGATPCHDGAGDAGTWKRLWSTTAYLTTGAECANCHGGLNETDWTFGMGTHSTTDGSVEHNYNWDGDSNTGEVIGSHSTCKVCHGANSGTDRHANYSANADFWAGVSSGNMHGDGSVTMNGPSGTGVGYNQGTFSCDTASACHGNATAQHNLEDSGWSVGFGNFGGATCAGCHETGGGVGAPIVTSTTSGNHVNPAGSGAPSSEMCPACHTGHADGTSGANHVEIQTFIASTSTNTVPTLSRNYSTHSYRIRLGGTATSSYANNNTEAGLCWGCHYTALSATTAEFGLNQNTTTGNMTYNYGTLSTWNATDKGGWYAANGTTVANWTSANFTMKNTSNALKSMHAADFLASGSGNDAIDKIRCTYCHDVHNTGAAPNGNPYIRGTWKGNPFPEDGPPQSGQIFTNYNTMGPFPRISKSSAQSGGYFINENYASGTPGTNVGGLGGDTNINNWAGLCERCHGTGSGSYGNGTWTATEIDQLDWVYNTSTGGTPSNGTTGDHADIWVGKILPSTPVNLQNTNGNGHANSVLGGTGGTSSYAADIYSERIRNPNTGAAGPLFAAASGDGSGGGRPSMGYYQNTANNAYGFRMHTGDYAAGKGWSLSPRADEVGRGTHPTMSRGFTWGGNNVSGKVTVVATGKFIDNKFHQFPCSKCHMPHASKLPRLMFTNCLQISKATWTGGYTLPTSAPAGVNKASESAQAINFFTGVSYPKTTMAVNCHRRANTSGSTPPFGMGWNQVTPW
jgi:hypothetical protein